MLKLVAWLLPIWLYISKALADTVVQLDSDQSINGFLRDDVEQFLGIPFAEPPTGDLRFKHPVPFQGRYDNFEATQFSKSCIGLNPGGISDAVNNLATPFNPILWQMAPVISSLTNMLDSDEDCLYLNIYRPKNTPPDAKLPVMIWLYGGAYIFGTGSSYNGAHYVSASERIDQPVIVVTSNYRVGPFGFLGGSAIADEGNGNAGLLDQRMAMEWVHDNIESFGGDPAKVTLFGESAGAMSIFYHLVANDGDHTYKGEPLFRAAIMQSGSALTFGTIRDHFPQSMYHHLADNAGCGGLDDTKTMECLRNADIESLKESAESFSIAERFGGIRRFIGWSPRADGNFISKPTMELLDEGKIAPIPYITGVNEDEGSIFGVLTDSFNEEDWQALFTTYYFNTTQEQKDTISRLYPKHKPAGCPYRTGYMSALTSQLKRINSFSNDMIFNVGRRKFLTSSPDHKRWTYFSDALHNIVPFLGTFHSNDIIWQWFINSGPFRVYQDYFIAFANHLDPNAGVSLADWPEYTDENKETLYIRLNDLGVTTDTFREEEIGYMIDNYKSLLV